MNCLLMDFPFPSGHHAYFSTVHKTCPVVSSYPSESDICSSVHSEKDSMYSVLLSMPFPSFPDKWFSGPGNLEAEAGPGTGLEPFGHSKERDLH